MDSTSFVQIQTEPRDYIETILSCLNQSNDPLSLSLRYILTLYLSGVLQSRIAVFADTFPNWNILGVAYDTRAFTGLINGHWHVIVHVRCTWRTPASQKSVANFTDDVIETLDLCKNGFFLIAFPELFRPHTLHMLKQKHGIDCKVIENHVTVVFEKNRMKLDSLRKALPILRKEHKLDRLRLDDVPFLVSYWFAKQSFQDVTDWFKWLVTHMPSVCIRDSDKRLIAWNLQYEFGAGGTKLRDTSDHKCHQYAKLICFYRSLQVAERFPQLENYGHILATNSEAFKNIDFMIKEIADREPVCFIMWRTSNVHSVILDVRSSLKPVVEEESNNVYSSESSEEYETEERAKITNIEVKVANTEVKKSDDPFREFSSYGAS